MIDNEPFLLFVEDDEDFLEILLRRFGRRGYHVTGAREPREALDAADFGRFEVAVVDHHLPNQSGLELMRRLRKQAPAMQVIILSGYTDEDSARQATEQGAFAFLSKPCRLSVLEETVEQALAERHKSKPVRAKN